MDREPVELRANRAPGDGGLWWMAGVLRAGDGGWTGGSGAASALGRPTFRGRYSGSDSTGSQGGMGSFEVDVLGRKK